MASYEQEALMEIGALAVGAAQPFLIRQFVDKKYGSVLPQLGVYGTPSALAGIIAGGIATAAALAGKFMNIGVRESVTQNLLLSYGVPALAASLAMAAVTQTVSATPQAYFAPQQGAVGVPTVGSPAAKNYQSLSPNQKNKLSVY